MGEEKEKLDRLRAKRGGHRTVVTLKHKQSENYSRTHRFRRYHVEPFESCWANIGWKANFTCGIRRGITKICSVDHIEEEIEVADEIRSRILQTKGEIAIARTRVKNGGTSSSTSSSPGSAQNHHTEEHAATNNPNQAPMPLQDNQHASSEIRSNSSGWIRIITEDCISN